MNMKRLSPLRGLIDFYFVNNENIGATSREKIAPPLSSFEPSPYKRHATDEYLLVRIAAKHTGARFEDLLSHVRFFCSPSRVASNLNQGSICSDSSDVIETSVERRNRAGRRETSHCVISSRR